MKGYLALLVAALAVAPPAAWLAGSPGDRAIAAAKVVVDEVAWAGTAADPNHEWIELYNNTAEPVDLGGWTLASTDGSPNVLLAGTIPAHGYYLLERITDCAVSDVAAGQPPYSGYLSNTGERLELRDGLGTLIDTADGSGGWPAGVASPDYSTMERIDPAAPDSPANWATNDGLTRNGHDCAGDPLAGTPAARNSATPFPAADLRLAKTGPPGAEPGAAITYTITLSNGGSLPAVSTFLTDLLPASLRFVTHTAPYPLVQPLPGTLVWELGSVPPAAAPITFTVTGRLAADAWGELVNVVTATSLTTEAAPADNHDRVVTLVGGGPIRIEALYYQTYESNQPDEAVRLMNVSPLAVDVGGWAIGDGTSTAILPSNTLLAPGQAIWCAHEASAFERQFGFQPDFEASATDPSVPDLAGTWPGFADAGDECLLRDARGETVDVLVYEAGDTAIQGWSGPAVWPWTSGRSFAAAGQILYRKRDQGTGLPVPDTDTAADWAQDPGDAVDGRKVLYPGWDLDAFFFTHSVTETAALTVAVAPDNLYATVDGLLAGARHTIQIESYSFGSPELADRLLDRLDHGVSVTLLLEGAPAFEGVSDEERWVAGRLHAAGAQVLFMVNDAGSGVHARYENQHSKILIVDGATALVGSENLNQTSFVADDKANGTAGRRGVYLITDAPGVVARLQALFAADADPAHHRDVVGCDWLPDLCTPPAGFEPGPAPDWITYTVQAPAPLSVQGTFAFEVLHSPENSLRDRDGLLGLLGRAAQGDTLLVEQSAEYVAWGPDGATPQTDPNPRLEAYLAAARRGAAVRVLLDAHFGSDDNAATVAYLQAAARAGELDLQVRLGDPTYLGLHNKMVLAYVGGQGYVHVGSVNGSEASSKANREVALQVRSDAAYDYLWAVFDYDWRASTPPLYLPLVVRGYVGPQRADHLLIGEVYYVTVPEKEWVEIYNPTAGTISLSGYKIGDAAHFDDAEGMYRFPPEASLGPGQVLVVAVTAAGFRQDFPTRTPDFEIFETDPAVPNLRDYGPWGTWDWGLANAGDEVLLLDGSDAPVDVLAYGAGSYPGVVPHPGVLAYGHSLERLPAWLDTGDCSADFRDWPYPGPGELP